MDLLDALAAAMRTLEALEARAALLGGLAVSVWSEPRFTRDADLAVAVASDAEAERLIHSLRAEGYALLTIVEQKAVDRFATARMLPPGQNEHGHVVDLLFASSGIEPEIVESAVKLDIGAPEPIAVARIGHLVALKLLSNDTRTRPQDSADLRALRRELDQVEVARAREACALIEIRGFARGRDLKAALETYLADDLEP